MFLKLHTIMEDTIVPSPMEILSNFSMIISYSVLRGSAFGFIKAFMAASSSADMPISSSPGSSKSGSLSASLLFSFSIAESAPYKKNTRIIHKFEEISNFS